MLAKCVKGARHQWDEFISEALFNCRVRKHVTLGKSPFKLVYGVEPKIPGDSTKPFVLQARDPMDAAEIRARLLDSIGQDRAAAIERSGLSAEQAKLRYDKLVKEDPLEIGTWVLLKRGIKLKFQSNWIGPFKIVNSSVSGIYQLADPLGNLKQDWVHRDRLKRANVDLNNPPKSFWSDETLEALDPVFGQGENDMDVYPC
jgi:hypothetical protein